jgi:hypothetical protein
VTLADLQILSLLSDAKNRAHDMKDMSEERLYKEIISVLENDPSA